MMKVIKKRGKIRKLASIMLIMLILGGCGVERRVIDDLSIVFGMGVEIDEEDSRILKITTYSPTQDEDSEKQTVQTTIKAYGVDSFIRNWQYERHRKLALGKIQVMAFGEMVMRTNFPKVLQEFREIPEIDINTRVVFYDGDPQHLFQVQVVEEQRFSIYLREVIERNVEAATIPDVNLHNLSTDLLTSGRTAFMPYVERNAENSRVIIKGLALLDNQGQLAIKLNDLETIFFMILSSPRIGAILDTKVILEDEKDATVIYEITQNKVYYDTKIVDGKPEINIRVRGTAEIRELSARDVEIVDEDTFNKLDEQLSRHLTTSAQNLINKLQKNNADPLGLGERVRVRHNDYYRQGRWEEDYPQIKITNDIKITVKRGSGFKRTS